ncbi:DUF2510 domain-containing protein [Mumia flava]|nr:DUF2510 domain-containing protein [Mumia flava]
MSEQAAAGWYPDGQGNERYWDGSSWTEHVRTAVEPVGPVPAVEPVAEVPAAKKEGTFGKLGAAVRRSSADKKAAKEELMRRQAEDAVAAGALVTSGVFGTSTIEIYENGFVRVASWAEGITGTGPKSIDKNTQYERLRSLKFTPPAQDRVSGVASALEGAVGPAVAGIFKGGKTLIKGSAPGLAMAGVAHLASNDARKSFLTIATDKQIHTLTNQRHNGVMKTSDKGHNEVALALEAAANAVLGVHPSAPQDSATRDALSAAAAGFDADRHAAPPSQPVIGSTVGERIRDLAALHRDGILSDEEFAAAKAKLLGAL